MSRIKPEKLAGVVALSYLVLIPVGVVYIWKKIQDIDKDVTELWNASYVSAESKSPRRPTIPQLTRLLKRVSHGG